jgi:chemotaxis protein histidine kinase CheA
MTITPSILAQFVDDIAFAAEAEPATTPQDFIDQLGTAAHNLDHCAQINGAEDLETAATYLTDAMEAKGAERRVLLNHAVKHLANTADMVDEYRLMI